MRIGHALRWKNSLLLHKYTMKKLLADHQTERIRQLESMLDYLHDAYNSICSLTDKLGTENLKASVHLETCTPRARIMKPFNKGASSRRLFKKKPEKPTIDFSKMKNSFGDKSSFYDGESAEFPVMKSLRYRNMEANLQMQTNYNSTLKDTLSENQSELKKTQEFMNAVQTDVFQTHQMERERWNRFLECYRANCERELLRKQDEVVELNQLLARWIQRFLSLEEEIQPKKAAKGDNLESDLKRLISMTFSYLSSVSGQPNRMKSLMMASPIVSERTSSAKYMTTVTLGTGDESPPCEGE